MIILDPYPRTLDQIFTPEARGRLERLGAVRWHDGPPLTDDAVEPLLEDAVAIIGQTSLSTERLARAPHLQAVLNVEGNFLPNIDYEECFRRGIQVLCIAPVYAQPVAEMALGLALAAAREIPAGDAAMRAGTAELLGGDLGEVFLLRGKTLGLIGCGNLGRALLPLLRPFGGRIIAHDPWLQDATLRELGVEPVGLEELLASSRVVFVLSAVTTENAHAIGQEQLDLLQDGSVFVLASRAAVVDWDALMSTAASGRVRVAVDVYPVEPIPADERARTTPNTVLSAHRAGAVPEIWPTVGTMVVDDLEWILRGLPPRRLQRADRETVGRYRSKPIE